VWFAYEPKPGLAARVTTPEAPSAIPARYLFRLAVPGCRKNRAVRLVELRHSYGFRHRRLRAAFVQDCQRRNLQGHSRGAARYGFDSARRN
jgi:hypothetical protein